MAGKQLSGDGLASNLAGMSKGQLYDIMCQMKALIEQNQHQAKQILVQNPLLTRALFQAQIMLGMVQPSQTVSSIQPQPSQKSSTHVKQQSVNVANSPPNQVGLQDHEQANLSQPGPVRKLQQHFPPIPPSSTSVQGKYSQPISPQPSDLSGGHMITQAMQMQYPTSGPLPPSVNQPPLPSHLQQPMQTTGGSHMLPPPLPQQLRPPMQVQYQPLGQPNVNYPSAGVPQTHHSQPMFHPSNRPSGGMGSYPHGQPPLPNQPPQQPPYQGGGSHFGTNYNNLGGSTMDRGPSWPHTSRENSSGAQQPTPPPLGPGPMPVGNQPHPQTLTPDAEQALIQQVMSLTPEQINVLPPEQRHQVLQLQQMLRQ